MTKWIIVCDKETGTESDNIQIWCPCEFYAGGKSRWVMCFSDTKEFYYAVARFSMEFVHNNSRYMYLFDSKEEAESYIERNKDLFGTYKGLRIVQHCI